MVLGKHSSIAKTGSDISVQVTIGNYTSIGPYVQMHTRHDHACIDNPTLVSTAQIKGYPHTTSRETISIGNDVWIGRNAVLLGGITIGDGAIIGAFSVVAKDIPPYAVAVGNPAIIKRYRFTAYQIKELLKIKWWDWDQIKIDDRITDLSDVDTFINKNRVD